MRRITLLSQDLSALRFSISPLNDLLLSVRALRVPGPTSAAAARIAAALEGLPPADAAVLRSLVNDIAATPDFAAPPPTVPLARISDEFATVRKTPPDIVAADLAMIHPDGLPAALTGPPELVLHRIVDALEKLWTGVFENQWNRLRATLEQDVLFRGRTAMRDGMRAMLDAISERVHVVDDSLVLEVNCPCPCFYNCTDQPLLLMPSTVAERTLRPTDPDPVRPYLIYPARGAAAVWEDRRGAQPGHLAKLLGSSRAEILATLHEPDSSTRIAARLGITPSATNQHLRAMRDSGLVTSRRCGRDVLYQRTELAESLLGGALPPTL